MTTHLSPDELVAALEGALEASQRDHVDACATCAARVEQLRTTLAAVRDEVPAPSPLFWDQLSARIRTATADEPIRRRAPWWASGWGRATGLGALAAAAATVLVLRMTPVSIEPARPVPAVSDAPSMAHAASDDASWLDMEEIAARLSADDVHAVVAAAPELAPTLGDLSAKEREAFVRLIGSELGGDLK